jgi:hypothetical protein
LAFGTSGDRQFSRVFFFFYMALRSSSSGSASAAPLTSVVYRAVMDDVIRNLKGEFTRAGVSAEVLAKLHQVRETVLMLPKPRNVGLVSFRIGCVVSQCRELCILNLLL